MSLAVDGARRVFTPRRGEEVRALDGVDLEVRDGELTVVIGPSGSGKTTLLRAVAGLDRLDAGTVTIGGADVTRLPPRHRDVAMVFQDLALYPHLSVAQNIGFGLTVRRTPRASVERAVAEASEVLGIHGLLARRPDELSGGERQRVALARAVVRRPAVFLLDEPLSGLDAQTRAEARDTVAALHRELGTSMLYVTHEQADAMILGERVVVLREGRVLQTGTPVELYDRPADAFTARLLGTPPMNLLPPGALGLRAVAALVGIRAEHVRLGSVCGERVVGRLASVGILGPDCLARVAVGGQTIVVRVGRDFDLAPGAEVGVGFEDDALHWFDE